MSYISENRTPFTIADVTLNINTVNRPAYLEACLASAIRTTPPGVPLQMVFNGTPTDVRERAMNQAAQWQGPTNFVVLDEMLSVSASHNRALESVQTALVNFMGDDDVILGNRLPVLVDTFNAHQPTPVVVTSHAHRIAGDPYLPAIGSIKKLGPTTIAEWEQFHRSGQPFEMLWPGAVLNVEALRSIGGFETPYELAFDTRIFSQMSFLGPVISSTDRQFGFRIHQGSMSSSNWDKQRESLRFIEACHRERLAGREAPTYEQFVRDEEAKTRFEQVSRRRSDRAQMLFRLSLIHI